MKTEKKSRFSRQILLNNIGLKLLALVVAMVVWTLIINIEDPTRSKTLVVPVQTINEDSLISVNKVYEVIEGDTASVVVTGKKSVIDRLDEHDIRAVADLSQLSTVNAVNVVASLKKSISSEVKVECNQVLKVSLEEMAKKQIRVDVETEGVPADGYSVGETVSKPNMIELTGGESAIGEIESVKVTVNVDGASEDLVRSVVPKAYDAKGEEVKSNTLSFGVKKVRVRVRFLQTKSLKVKVKVTGQPADGYEYVGVECSPEEIVVAGDTASLAAMDELEIPVSIEGMRSDTGSVEQNISAQDYLMDTGLTVLEGYTQISLKISIDKLETKRFTVDAGDIQFLNVPDGYKARVSVKPNTLKLTVRGGKEALAALDDSDITAYVNCKDLEEGKHVLQVHINERNGFTLASTNMITVRLTPVSAEKNTPTPEPTATDDPTKEP